MIETVPLGNVVGVSAGQPAPKSSDFSDYGHPFIRAGSVERLLNGSTESECEKITDETANRLRLKLHPRDTVVFAKSGMSAKIGRVYRLREPAYVASHLATLVPTGEYDPSFLTYWLRQFPPSHLIKDEAYPSIRVSDIAELRVPLLPVREQHRIATILDKAYSIRTKRQQALNLANDVLKAEFRQLLREDHWPTAELSDVVAEGTIVTYGIVQAGAEYTGGVPYIRTGDIKDGKIVVDGLRRTAPEIAAKFSRSTVRTGDIVMSIRATVGTTAIVPRELDGANLTQGTARISPGSRVTREYLLWYLRSSVCQNWIETQVKGATFREITLTRLREMEVPLPPMERQREFSRFAQKLDSVVRTLEEGLAATSDLFASLSQRAFRGEL